MLSQILVLAMALTLGLAANLTENKEFIRCAKAGNAALEGLSEQQLIDLTQKNLQTATEMVNKRSDAAKAQGLSCYYDFNNVYGAGVTKIMGPEGEPKVLSLATSDALKAKATKEIAGMTMLIICDEQYRANHMNDKVECNLLERNGAALFEFNARLPVLETLMGVGGTLLKACTVV